MNLRFSRGDKNVKVEVVLEKQEESKQPGPGKVVCACSGGLWERVRKELLIVQYRGDEPTGVLDRLTGSVLKLFCPLTSRDDENKEVAFILYCDPSLPDDEHTGQVVMKLGF